MKRGKISFPPLPQEKIIKNFVGGEKMKFGNVFKICLALVVFTLLCPSMSSGSWTQVFYDDFTGTALDTSQWSVFVDKNGEYHWPYVEGGFLKSQGYHTRIDSIPAFAPMGQSVMARARISLAGNLQKFGFGVNPIERAGPITGYYFDTRDDSDSPPGREGYVRAQAWFAPAFGSWVNLLDVEIPVTWYEFHEFAIERTPSEVIYSIDDQEVARVADAFGGALPVGVWNDRWSLMQTDWVEVVTEPAIVEATVDIDPDTLNLKSKGKWITCYIELPEGYDVADIDVSTIMLNGQVPAESKPTAIADYDSDGIADLMVKFSRSAVQNILPPEGEAEITVAGELADGTAFEGKDTIRIIDKGK